MAAQDLSIVVYRARTEALADRLLEKLNEIPVEAAVTPERLGGVEPGDTGYAVCVRANDQPAAEKATRSGVSPDGSGEEREYFKIRY